jgi:hypothetical protein
MGTPPEPIAYHAVLHAGDEKKLAELRERLMNLQEVKLSTPVKYLNRGVSKHGEVVTFRCRPCEISLRGLPLAAANAFSAQHQLEAHSLQELTDPDGLM